MAFRIFSLLLVALLASTAGAACLPFADAGEHIGETRCVTGKVVRVEQGGKGVHYLDFCNDYESCPFTVVVFASDLRYVGDVRHLAGRVIEVSGLIKLYGGRAEIILRQPRQLSGETAAMVPPLPKNYDVARKGRYSAGKYGHARSSNSSARKRSSPRVQTEDQNAPPGAQN
jgi:DNA/RNA endonuclease YhcR with UshA esterase domain